LLRFDTSTKEFDVVDENDGLPSNTIYGILEDRFGTLWLSTNSGIVRFDPETCAMTRLDVKYGLQGNEFNLGAYCETSNGELLFGGDYGIDGIMPLQDINRKPPFLRLVSFQTFGAEMKFEQPITMVQEIELPHDRNQLSFEFVGVHLVNPKQNQYAYMLEGHDHMWNLIGTRREASFAYVPPGDYRFMVKAANSDGVWSEPLVVRVHIALPFWRAWWFYALVVALAGGSAYGAYRFKVRQAVQRAVELERVRREVEERARQRLQKSVHDQIAGHAAKAARELHDLEQDLHNRRSQAGTSVGDIRESINMLINQLCNLNWQVDPTKDSLFDLLAQLQQYAENLFCKTEIRFTLMGVHEDFMHVKLPMEWREELLLLFEEAINNVVKHAPNCTIARMTTTLVERVLELCLNDDGEGFDEEKCKRKNGLLHMRERAAALGGELLVTSSKGIGTRVCFRAKLP
jgi:signal transduction histidine kinase